MLLIESLSKLRCPQVFHVTIYGAKYLAKPFYAVLYTYFISNVFVTCTSWADAKEILVSLTRYTSNCQMYLWGKESFIIYLVCR